MELTIYVPVENNRYEVVIGARCPICGEHSEINKGMILCTTHGWIEV